MCDFYIELEMNKIRSGLSNLVTFGDDSDPATRTAFN